MPLLTWLSGNTTRSKPPQQKKETMKLLLQPFYWAALLIKSTLYTVLDVTLRGYIEERATAMVKKHAPKGATLDDVNDRVAHHIDTFGGDLLDELRGDLDYEELGRNVSPISVAQYVDLEAVADGIDLHDLVGYIELGRDELQYLDMDELADAVKEVITITID